MNLKSLLLPFFLLVAVACGRERGPQNVAERFLSAYLECRYTDAEPLASAEAMEQMRWRLSQLTQAEVELINDNEPQVSAEEMSEGGDSCVVTLRATDALLMDSIGLPAHIGDGRFRLILVRESNRNWTVAALATIP